MSKFTFYLRTMLCCTLLLFVEQNVHAQMHLVKDLNTDALSSNESAELH